MAADTDVMGGLADLGYDIPPMQLPPEYEDQPRARITVTPQRPAEELPPLPPTGGVVGRSLPPSFFPPPAPEQPGIVERSLPKVYDPMQQQQQDVAKAAINLTPIGSIADMYDAYKDTNYPGMAAAAATMLPIPGAKGAGVAAKAVEKGVAGFAPKAPAILSRAEPTMADIAAIRARAQEVKLDPSTGSWSPRGPWPTAEREVFSTAPEAYAETTKLVPQTSIKGRLPGPLPGEDLPNAGRAEQIVANTGAISDRIAERLYPLVERQDPLLKFYHTAPVIRGLGQHADMSLAEANTLMRNWAGQGAATSPRTSTPPNLRNTSSLMYERAQDNPFTLERFKKEGNIPGYGMMGMHVQLGEKFANDTVNPWKNPKPFTFRENWSGNLADVTGDTHNIRATLFEMDNAHPGQLHPSFFHGGEKGDAYKKYKSEGFRSLDPGDINDSLGSTTVKKIERQSEYLPMVEPWYQAAQKLGIHPAEAQSGGWFNYGKVTGLSSPPKTIVNLLNDQVADTARTLGVSPEKVVNWWARGKIPLAGAAGAAAIPQMGSIADQENYQQ